MFKNNMANSQRDAILVILKNKCKRKYSLHKALKEM